MVCMAFLFWVWVGRIFGRKTPITAGSILKRGGLVTAAVLLIAFFLIYFLPVGTPTGDRIAKASERAAQIMIPAFQVLLLLFFVDLARRRRKACQWGPQQVQKTSWLSAAGIVLAIVLTVLGPAQPGSPLAILSIVLLYFCVYTLSKALFRKVDLRKASG